MLGTLSDDHEGSEGEHCFARRGSEVGLEEAEDPLKGGHIALVELGRSMGIDVQHSYHLAVFEKGDDNLAL